MQQAQSRHRNQPRKGLRLLKIQRLMFSPGDVWRARTGYFLT